MSDVYETRDVQAIPKGKRKARTYRVQFHCDIDMGAPWKEHDGHGVISEWASRDKRPCEVIISQDRNSKRFYDVGATLVIAKRDAWGIGDAEKAKLASKLGRVPTANEVTAHSVQMDMERMRAWCNDDWHWCGVSVFPLNADGDELRSKTQSLWGIESDAGPYFEEVIAELIAQIEG